ncbi:polysaccharide pyruvyl transferase family protein [Azospirillum picis]|uniref:Polysaccharide pyruvyl transferase WcaK-like protein n=1 Tax=Azospirillum picis TaxID=488438 RepID=A0ABU0MRQ9_9PROT|nr:polysaccharide pyruvyl transferase family protein [Azospirillum picis]MBP2300849.1 polysaccharide pyruvyl transferase WcaK-like protein [Azospirillum picis]MDQ0536106.1 polysaccharide pyruvyl transferase WcaK-like protein [Azospirillum picis]
MMAARRDEAVRHGAAPARRVVLFGLFGSGNSGNDASLEAMLGFLRRRPGIELTCICSAPEQVATRYGIRGVAIGARPAGGRLVEVADRLLGGLPRRAAGFGRAVLMASRADALIFPGTGILDDFGTGPFGLPLAVFGWCLGARLGGARIAFVSIGAGPIHHPLSRWLMGRAAAMAQYRSYRDTVSRDFMAGIGVAAGVAADGTVDVKADAEHDAVFPDLAFALPTPPVAAAPGPGLTVGLGVMGYYGWSHDLQAGAGIHRTYLDKLRRFTLWLLDQGCRVRLLTGDAGDRDTVAALAAALRAERPDLAADRLSAEPTADLQALMGQIAGTDLVVATRFHNIVAALKLGRPVLSIGYASKNDDLLAAMGLADFCQHIETLDVDRLIRQFTALRQGRAAHGRRIRARVAVYRRRLDEQDALLAARLPLAGRKEQGA